MKSKYWFAALGGPLMLSNCVQCPPDRIGLTCCGGFTPQTVMSVDTGKMPWRVKPPFSSAWKQTVVVSGDSQWTANLLPALWIGAIIPPGTDPAGNYIYELNFHAPPCLATAGVTVSGAFAADNKAEVYVDSNSTPVAVSGGPPGFGFTNAGVTSFTAPVPATTSGVHILRVVVTNNEFYHGLVMRGEIRAKCSGGGG